MKFLRTCFLNEDLKALNNIERFSLEFPFQRETVSQHSYWVVFFVLITIKFLKQSKQLSTRQEESIYNNFLLGCLIRAVIHDMGEAFTGDVRHQTKYEYGTASIKIKEGLNEIEKMKMEELFGKIIPISFRNEGLEINSISAMVKFGDWCSCYMFSRKEFELGNLSFEKTFIKAEGKLKESIVVLKNILLKEGYDKIFDLEKMDELF